MKSISPQLHAILDYLTVLFLAVSPTLFKMEGGLATFTYTLAVIHFLLTILTRFPFGIIKIIPFALHGLIELGVALVLVAISLWFNQTGNMLGFYFYIWLAVVILIVFFLTDFGLPKKANDY